MQQLSGLDTTFLNIETPTTYGHVCGLTIYDPTTATTVPTTFDDLKRLLAERLHLVPPFRWRLVEVPLGLDHPYWIEDPQFDLDFHVRHIGLPAPGTKQQLAAQVERIVARPLDRSRPLWELYLIEGLENGHVAQLTKFHHSAIDGVSGAELLAATLDLEPVPRQVEPPDHPWEPDREPTELEMFNRGLAALSRRPRKDARLLLETLSSLPELIRSAGIEFPRLGRRRLLDDGGEAPLLSQATTKPPRTSFNSMIGRHRRFAFLSVSLEDVRTVKNTFGVTVNDVVLAISASALRRYLIGRDELPDDPLVAMVPISVRTEEENGQFGNQVASMTASLHTDLSDPVERLMAIHESMMIAKQRHRALPAKLQAEVAEFLSPAIGAQAERMVIRAAAKGWINLPYNVVISNVPGPQFPLYGVGAKLLANYPVSTITDGSGLNITAQSYNGNLDIGVVGCRELVPGVWEIADDIEAAMVELLAAAEQTAAGTSPADERPTSAKGATKATDKTKAEQTPTRRAAKTKATGGRK